MTESIGKLSETTRTGKQLTLIVVAGLFLFALWETSGMSLRFSTQSVQATHDQILHGLAQRAAGSTDIANTLKWVVFAGIGIFLHFANKSRAYFVWSKAWPLLLLLVLILLSVLWSAVPDIAVRRAVKHLLLIAVLAGVVMGSPSTTFTFRLAVVFTGLMMTMNFASVILLPGVAFDESGALTGLHGHKNSAGVFAMIAIFVWLTAAHLCRGMFARVFLSSGALLWFVFQLGTDARAATGATILAIVVVVLLRFLMRKPISAVICSIAAIFVALTVLYLSILLNISIYDIAEFMEGERATLSSRFNVWEIAYEAFLHHMVLGTGFGSLWSTGSTAPAAVYGNVPITSFYLGLTHSHNGYLDILATLGLVGAVALSIFLASAVLAVLKAFRQAPSDSVTISAAELCGFVFVAIAVVNITTSNFLAQNIVWSSLVLCYLSLFSAQLPSDEEAMSGSDRAGAPMSHPKSPAAIPQSTNEPDLGERFHYNG